jgi:alpha-galactosidase
MLACGICLAGAPDDAGEYILTPKPGLAPHINGPALTGARPGKPFLYRIPATGQRPMRFAVRGLPSSLRLDPDSGIISGSVPEKAGEYVLTLEARNAQGRNRKSFKIVAGDRLALTPPMGWNDWYTHYHRITDRLVREAADVMIASGMADYGYQYVNIDDCWMVKPGAKDAAIGGAARAADGSIRPNSRFPDMKGLTDYIHSKGLKAGLYTSPGPLTCAEFTGSWQHEEADARTFAKWGFDFLKYDWCSYTSVAPDKTLASLKKPYALMGGILKGLDRDVVFNLCQYGMGDVAKWGGEVGGHSWRTTGDLGLEKAKRLPGFYSIGLANQKNAPFAGPGRWNDPDYILIGVFGEASVNGEGKKTSLTPDEQYSYMSMWSLMAAPLFFSGDMGKLDPFTLGILCNAEVIDVNQDAAGSQARTIRQDDNEFVLSKRLSDGSTAIGLFNISEQPREIAVAWKELGVRNPARVRDVWRQRDLGVTADRYSVTVPRHGVRFVRLFPRVVSGESSAAPDRRPR